MTTTAVVLAVLWLLTAFVLRIAIQVRRTGDTGVRIGADSPAARAVKVLFTSALALVAIPPAFVAAGSLDAIDGLTATAAQWLGAVLAVAGIVATFVAQLAMGRSWRIGVDPDERTELVTDGVFAVVRNPIFSTMVVTAVGLVLMVPTAPGIAGLVLTLVSLELQVRGVEEPYLRQVHGAAYRAYERRVGRFVPRPTR